MTGDDEDYRNDVDRMKAGLAEIDFDQLSPKQIEAHDRKTRKTTSKGKVEGAAPKAGDERPRLKIEKQSPDRTVAACAESSARPAVCTTAARSSRWSAIRREAGRSHT
jgi:hypothetical protein